MNMTKAELLSNLDQFIGTQYYYPLWPTVFLTDGTKYLSETAGCYWLMDAIASHLKYLQSSQAFVCCKFTCQDSRGHLIMTDGNETNLAKQRIPFTDFPISEITLYSCHEVDKWIILLPSEY